VFLVGGNEKEVGTSQVVTRDPMVVLVGGKAAQGGRKGVKRGMLDPGRSFVSILNAKSDVMRWAEAHFAFA
jgi:hypothetical protein